MSEMAVSRALGWDYKDEMWAAHLDCGHVSHFTPSELRHGLYHAVRGEMVPCPECDQGGESDE